MSVECSVIIPHLDQEIHLKECLSALDTQSGEVDYEIIVVDDSTPGIDKQSIQEEYPRLQWITTDGVKNPYTMRNAGIQAAQGEYIACIDAKCRVRHDWLSTMIQAMSDHDIVAGRYELSYTSDGLRDKVYGILYLNNQKNVKHEYGISAGNMMTTKQIMMKTGGFDDRHHSGRDILWSREALSRGLRIGYSHDSVIHYPAQTWIELSQKVNKYADGSRHQGVKPSWRSWMPLRWTTYQEALCYRGLDDLSITDKLKLYYYASCMKWKYNLAL